ncbi:MAG: hypothetical protein JHC84_10795 [Solirubrobacteraceae bacterium]|nr:hypothetical protein [Solirubrobacteraceae bacterium]
MYASLWDCHVLPRLGALQLREITPSVVNRFRLDCEADGVGRVSIAKAMTLLQGVLQRACEWERIASNPVRAVRKPAAGPRRAVVPISPDVVEEMRAWLVGRSMWRDATLVSVLAYAGLRPGEALALTWAHVRERTLLVDHRGGPDDGRTWRLVVPVGAHRPDNWPHLVVGDPESEFPVQSISAWVRDGDRNRALTAPELHARMRPTSPPTS